MGLVAGRTAHLAAPGSNEHLRQRNGDSYAAFPYMTSTYIVTAKMLICLWSNGHLRAKWASSVRFCPAKAFNNREAQATLPPAGKSGVIPASSLLYRPPDKFRNSCLRKHHEQPSCYAFRPADGRATPRRPQTASRGTGQGHRRPGARARPTADGHLLPCPCSLDGRSGAGEDPDGQHAGP